jgi:hypothetical protein
VCVEPDHKTNQLKGAPRRIRIDIRNFLLVYFAYVGSPQDNRHAADELAESIETLLHKDATLGGLVIDSMVDDVESGYVTKSGSLVRGSRITFSAQSQGMLPSN